MRIFLLFLIMLILTAYIGQLVATAKPTVILLVVIGLVFSVLTIINLEWGLYILIFVIPFTVQYSLGNAVQAGTDDLFLLFLIFSWLANRARAKEEIFIASPLNWPFVLFFIAGAISLIQLTLKLPEDWVILGALHFLRFFEYVFIFFIVISCVKELPQLRKFTIAFFINVGIIATIQIVQNMIGGKLTPGIFYTKNIAVHYAIATFQSNAILGAFYCFSLPIVVGLILTLPSSRAKVVLVIFSIGISFALFNTFARSAYLGIILAIFVITMLKGKRLYLILLALLILSPIFIQRVVLERITLTVQTVNPNVELDPSAQVRIEVWGKAVKVFAENPFFGVGWWGGRKILGSEAHSQFWTYLIEIGIFGFGIFLWLMMRILKIAFWVKNNAPNGFIKGLGLGYIGGLVALLTTCLFSESLEAFRMVGPLWFMTGLVVAARNIMLRQTVTSGGQR